MINLLPHQRKVGITYCVWLMTVVIFGCNSGNGQDTRAMDEAAMGQGLYYDLNNPEQRYFMGYELEELSGLSYLEDGRLACIQDEDGILFVYDTQKKKVTERMGFHKSGDYEGVEVVGDWAYVVRSDGRLFKFPMEGEEKVIEKIETPLTSAHDVEGLAYDPTTGRLVIACKEKGKGESGGKPVFAFDRGLDIMVEPELFRISKKDIRKFLDMSSDEKIGYGPSGVAIHPIEKNYYIVSHRGKWLLVVDREHQLVAALSLDPKLFRQPEGICFAPNGDLYIGNEGNGGDGYILKFSYLK